MGSIGVLLAQKLFASIDDPEGKTLSSTLLSIYSNEFRSSTFSKWYTI
jgi:phosphoribosylformylglycinamidine (FGAM) synthase PurS component